MTKRTSILCNNPECEHAFTDAELDAGEVFSNIAKISVRCPECREGATITFKELMESGKMLEGMKG